MGKKKSHDTQLRGFDDAEVDKLTEGIANLMGSEEKQWLEKLREMHPNALVAFCAGSAPKNGGEGGTAAYAVYFPLENDPMVSSPVTGKVTNYRADCEAAKEATTTIADKYDLERERELVVYSLCQNLVNAMADSPRWIDKWQRNGWKNSNKKPVEHQDIFKALLEAETHRTISWRFVDATNGPEWCYKLHEDTKKYASRVAYSAAKEGKQTGR